MDEVEEYLFNKLYAACLEIVKHDAENWDEDAIGAFGALDEVTTELIRYKDLKDLARMSKQHETAQS